MTARSRRLAVIDDHGMLLGLLCLKRTGLGFCSDTDVQARADERRNPATRTGPWSPYALSYNMSYAKHYVPPGPG